MGVIHINFFKSLFNKDKKQEIKQANPISDLSQIFSPDRIDEYEDHLRIDDMYCRVLVVETLPEFICFGWFDDITTIAGVTVSVALHPYNKKEANDIITREQVTVGADLRLAMKHGDTTRTGALETKYGFYYNFLTDLQLDRNNLVAATITISVTAPSYLELLYKCEVIKDRLGVTKAVTMYQRQLDGFTHTLPFISSLNEYHDVDIANAACLSPLISSDFTHPSGIYFGLNQSGSPVFLDLFIGAPRLFGPHMFICGSTRSGKSYTVKGITARSIANGMSVVIIDPEGEYRKIVQAMGGVLVRFKPNMECMFNIFDIEPEEDEETGVKYLDIAGKAEEICHLITSMIESQSNNELTAEERAIAARAVRAEYLSREINENPESIYQAGGTTTTDGAIHIGKTYKEMPTISSFIKRLENLGAERLATMLYPFTKEGGMGYFDGQSIGKFYDNQLVVFDVSGLKTEFQRIYAMFVMTSWAWEKFVKKDRTKRKRLLVDEAWLMMRHKDTASFLSDLARRGAKYNTSLMLASQSFREFTSEEGKVILAMCNTKFFLKMHPNEAKSLTEIFHLPTETIKRIESFKQGEGILQANMESAIVQFKGFPFEEDYLRSDPEAILAVG